MLRHLSTGAATLATLMAATRQHGQPAMAVDIRRLLAELGDHAPPFLTANRRPETPAAAKG